MRVPAEEFAEAKMNDAAAAENAAAGLEKDLTAVKNEIARLSQQIADAVNALAAAAQDQGRHGLRRARANLDSAVSGASNNADAVASVARNATSAVADALADVVQDRPVAAVALAIGVGFVIGVAWRR